MNKIFPILVVFIVIALVAIFSLMSSMMEPNPSGIADVDIQATATIAAVKLDAEVSRVGFNEVAWRVLVIESLIAVGLAVVLFAAAIGMKIVYSRVVFLNDGRILIPGINMVVVEDSRVRSKPQLILSAPPTDEIQQLSNKETIEELGGWLEERMSGE